MGAFFSVLNFLGKFNKHSKDTIRYDPGNKFKEYLLLVDKNDKQYGDVVLATELCDSAMKIAKQRMLLIKKHQKLSDKLEELECYEKLTDVEVDYLKDLANRFVSLTKERNVLRHQIIGFDSSLDKIIEYEAEAPKAIMQMEEAERKQRILKQDLGYLEGEKSELEYEKENLEFGLEFIYRFTIGVVIFFGVATMLLAMLNVFSNVVIFLPLAILVILLIFLVSLIYFFKRKIRFELKMNVKKQLRAVELLNKKRVVFAYYTNFLRYEYKKYKVKSSEALRVNLHEYGRYKHVANRYDSIRSIMYQTQDLLEQFLLTKNIRMANASIETFAQTINIDDKKVYYKKTMDEKAIIEENLEEFDRKHEAIWDELSNLDANDRTNSKVVGRIIQAYIDEVGGLFSEGEEIELLNEDEPNTNSN